MPIRITLVPFPYAIFGPCDAHKAVRSPQDWLLIEDQLLFDHLISKLRIHSHPSGLTQY
jgi:hypothetical protein